ncbi:MAG TPA: hypothetical protein VLG37_05695 [Candidatus Saccharimonadales bacterium]|nr:hypothetical protein [Candidatus Saccharimonadales bacterium]
MSKFPSLDVRTTFRSEFDEAAATEAKKTAEQQKRSAEVKKAARRVERFNRIISTLGHTKKESTYYPYNSPGPKTDEEHWVEHEVVTSNPLGLPEAEGMELSMSFGVTNALVTPKKKLFGSRGKKSAKRKDTPVSRIEPVSLKIIFSAKNKSTGDLRYQYIATNAGPTLYYPKDSAGDRPIHTGSDITGLENPSVSGISSAQIEHYIDDICLTYAEQQLGIETGATEPITPDMFLGQMAVSSAASEA